VSQTIGQQSVIGNYTRDGKTYGQGFQQSMWSNYIKGNAANTITDSLGNVPSLTTFAIGAVSSTGFEINGWMQKINYWPQRITNAEVQAFSK
jgi:hypothetical protein